MISSIKKIIRNNPTNQPFKTTTNITKQTYNSCESIGDSTINQSTPQQHPAVELINLTDQQSVLIHQKDKLTIQKISLVNKQINLINEKIILANKQINERSKRELIKTVEYINNYCEIDEEKNVHFRSKDEARKIKEIISFALETILNTYKIEGGLTQSKNLILVKFHRKINFILSEIKNEKSLTQEIKEFFVSKIEEHPLYVRCLSNVSTLEKV